MKLENKIVWITGASSGIGEALAYELSKKGCKLILSSRTIEALEQVKANCVHPEHISILPLDLADITEIPQITKKAISLYGNIDVLVNNAGISQRSLIADTAIEVYNRLMQINYLGTIALTKSALPHFIAKKEGTFVTVTSLMGRFGSPYRSGYCAAKHALHGFFDVLRMEHDKDNIQVTLICPGFVQTNVAKNALTANGSKQGTQDKATENGLEPQTFALKMIRAIEKEKHEAYIGQKEILGIYLKRWFPKFLHKVVLKSQVT